MSEVDRYLAKEYEAGFVTAVEAETLTPGLSEEAALYFSIEFSLSLQNQ